jgi:hypothetical protein
MGVNEGLLARVGGAPTRFLPTLLRASIRHTDAGKPLSGAEFEIVPFPVCRGGFSAVGRSPGRRRAENLSHNSRRQDSVGERGLGTPASRPHDCVGGGGIAPNAVGRHGDQYSRFAGAFNIGRQGRSQVGAASRAAHGAGSARRTYTMRAKSQQSAR